MWTNRVTWPRVSPWNDGHRPRRALAIVRCLVVGLGIISGCGLLSAQEVPAERAAPAFLLNQPHPGTGVPLLPPNALPHRRAEYRWGGRMIVVFHVASPAIPGNWIAAACDLSGFTRWAEAATVALFRYDMGAGQALLFAIGEPIATANEVACRFAAAFVVRYRFFAELRGPLSAAPIEFPAVLEID